MKCTSRNCFGVFILLALLGLCACKGESYDMPYDPDTQITAFTFDSNNKEAGFEGFASSLCVADEDVMPEGDIIPTAEAGGLFDVNGKNTLICKNANLKMNPASLTKVMTAYLALKYGNLEDTLTASSNVLITESGAQLLGLKEGDKMTLDQALHGLLLYSANDCGVMIAEYVSGSVESFASLMTKTAQELGATNTNFTNPHGLTDEEHYTTVYDLYLIFNEAMKYDEFLKIINETDYSCTYKDRDGNSKTFECSTTNGYLNGKFSGPDGVTVFGGKTGTTAAAGNCLILLSYDSSNNPYISVILNDSDHDLMYGDMTNLLNDIP